MQTSKRKSLASAVGAFVEPGTHLHFAACPSRANAAILQVVHRFLGTRPELTLSTTGFHSVAHLLGLHRLGRRYVSCFFGDNFPIPRPNELYTTLSREGALLESWSLWSFVAALRAGALGEEFAVNRSFFGTTMGKELAAVDKYREMQDPPLGLVRAMRPDVAFVHALFGDDEGHAVFSPPYCEGFWGAIGAKVGVIVTVEKFVDAKTIARYPDDVKLPADRVLAICEAPFGTHPQPLYGLPRFDTPGYRDDFVDYERWRVIAQDERERARFDAAVLAGDAEGVTERYRRWVGPDRLSTLASEAAALQSGRPLPRIRVATPARPRMPTPVEGFNAPTRENEILLLLGARAIVERVLDKGYRTILAGIGHGFVASRVAKLWLAERGVDVKVMVETGLYDLECGPRGNEFPLAYDNIAQAKKLSSVEDVLATLTCGADNACLGVLGAGQIDERGDINSTRTANGKMLVGSGGANDIAASSAEVVVLTRHTTSRLVKKVDYVTSPGRRVQTIVTNLAVLSRKDEDRWRLATVYPAFGGRSISMVLDAVQKGCPWPYDIPADLDYAPLMSTAEMLLLHTLERTGSLWQREGGR